MPYVEKLILRCQKKDRKAFDELYRVYSPIIYGICLRYTKERNDANDLMQECFILIMNKICDYKFLGNFEGWLRRLTVNTAINYLNTNTRIRYEEYNNLSKSPDENNIDILSNMESDELIMIINRLPDNCRIVFNMRVVEGYKLIEIAEILNINVNTCRSQYKKARELLMRFVKEIE